MLTFLTGIACPNYFLSHPLLRSWCHTPWQNSIVRGLLHTPAQCEWLEAHQNSPEQNPAGSSVVWGPQDSPCSWLHNSPYSALEVGTEKFHPLLSAPRFPKQDPGQLLGATRNVSPEEHVLPPRRTEAALTGAGSLATLCPSLCMSVGPSCSHPQRWKEEKFRCVVWNDFHWTEY